MPDPTHAPPDLWAAWRALVPAPVPSDAVGFDLFEEVFEGVVSPPGGALALDPAPLAQLRARALRPALATASVAALLGLVHALDLSITVIPVVVPLLFDLRATRTRAESGALRAQLTRSALPRGSVAATYARLPEAIRDQLSLAELTAFVDRVRPGTLRSAGAEVEIVAGGMTDGAPPLVLAWYLVDAAVSAGLDRHRPLLLAGLPPAQRGALPIASTPRAQLASDLIEMCQMPPMAGARHPPLISWLLQAAKLSEPLPEAAVFAQMRALLTQ